MMSGNNGALHGVRVIELTVFGVGPMCGKVLADFGAEVLKVEAPNPQAPAGSTREGGNFGDRSTLFVEFNRNKKGIIIDLKTPLGLQTLKQLVAISDVLIENLNPKAINNLGIPYAILRQCNPTLIMISLSGVGKAGTNGHWVGVGQILSPYVGKTVLWNHPYMDHPVGQPTTHPDYFSGILGATVVLEALYHRSVTGQGLYFDFSQAEAASTLIGPQNLEYSVNKRVPGPKGNNSDFMSPHGIYRCKGEDRWVAIAVRTDEEWRRFSKAIGSPDWSRRRRFVTMPSRVNCRDELDSLVEEWTSQRDPLEIIEILQAQGIPAGEVSSTPDLKDNDQLKARDFWVPLCNPSLGELLYSAPPVRLSKTPWEPRRSAPLIGEHDREVFQELLGLGN